MHAQLEMMIILWEEKYWEYYKQPMLAKGWKELVGKINVAFQNEVL
jgi:hypothetical protein